MPRRYAPRNDTQGEFCVDCFGGIGNVSAALGNAALRGIIARLQYFSRAIDNRPYRGNGGFCGGIENVSEALGIPPTGYIVNLH